MEPDPTILGEERWEVGRDDGGTYRRDGDRLVVAYPDQDSVDLELGEARAPSGEWGHWAEHWVEELVLPHRLVGLLHAIELLDDDVERSRWRGRPACRQPEVYTGIAREEVLDVEFTAHVEGGVLVEAVATTWTTTSTGSPSRR